MARPRCSRARTVEGARGCNRGFRDESGRTEARDGAAQRVVPVPSPLQRHPWMREERKRCTCWQEPFPTTGPWARTIAQHGPFLSWPSAAAQPSTTRDVLLCPTRAHYSATYHSLSLPLPHLI